MEQTFFTKRWIKIGLWSLVFVAVWGMMMRYKIAFDFPFFKQKFLIHAHSHFALTGWIGHLLYLGVGSIVLPYINAARKRWYNFLIWINVISSFGMLIAFTLEGYKAVSITFSTLVIVVGVAFAVLFIHDSKLLPKENKSRYWASIGLICNIVASVGPLYLGYLMATNQAGYSISMACIYFYLHFLYNGWFLFGTIAIIINYLPNNFPSLKNTMILLSITTIPTYTLSIITLFKFPDWCINLVSAATLVEVCVWFYILTKGISYFRNHKELKLHSNYIRLFIYSAAFAMSLKFILQGFTIDKAFSIQVYGIRSIVIGYLHLVFLGVYSLFYIGLMLQKGFIKHTKIFIFGAIFFFIGVFFNELFLGIQGGASIFYIFVPYMNESLLGAAIVLLVSAIWMATSSKISERISQ
ncbi:MAG: hypothetical protein M9887_11810 [Chitinophagales bacterium]|nr:hypothetical protein [Chitinophagales bacterium]